MRFCSLLYGEAWGAKDGKHDVMPDEPVAGNARRAQETFIGKVRG